MPDEPVCDCGPEEPPDPEPGCGYRADCSTGAARNFYSEGDPVEDAIEILEDITIYPEIIWIQRQYPEPLSQATWLAEFGEYVASDHVRVAEYSEAYPYPHLNDVGTLKGSGNYYGMNPDQTLGNTLNGLVYGFIPYYGFMHTLELYMYNGSNLVDVSVVPYLVIQHRTIMKDGVCLYQARKFGPYANVTAYAAALAEFPEIPASGEFMGWGAGSLPPFSQAGGSYNDQEYAVEALYPWEFEQAIPLPLEGYYDIDLPSEWFSNGTNGVNIKLSSISVSTYNMGGPAVPSGCTVGYDTYNWTITGGPSWLSTTSFTSPGCESVTINTARTRILSTPEGVWYDGTIREIRSQTSLVPVSLCEVLPTLTKNGRLDIMYRGGVCASTQTTMYAPESPSYPSYSITDSESACQNVSTPAVYSVATFMPDMAISPQNSHAVSVIHGTWYIFLEEDTPYNFTHHPGGVPNGSPFNFYSPLANPNTIRSGTVTIKGYGPPAEDCICFVYGTNAAGYDHVPQAPGNVIPPEVISFWLANDLEIVAGNCSSHAYPDIPCFCDGSCFYKRNASHTGYDLYHPDDYLKGCRKTEEQVLAGLSTTQPVLKPEPCMPEDCSGHSATWLGQPSEAANSDGLHEINWFLLDDCPGGCVSDQPLEPRYSQTPVFIDVPCRCA